MNIFFDLNRLRSIVAFGKYILYSDLVGNSFGCSNTFVAVVKFMDRSNSFIATKYLVMDVSDNDGVISASLRGFEFYCDGCCVPIFDKFDL